MNTITPTAPLLEVCCATPGSILAAQRGGASRLELCSALSEGGLTPSLGLIHAAVRTKGLRTHVLIRPRGGDFCYTEDEQPIILSDIEIARRAGAHGVVVGALTTEGDLDLPFLRQMRITAEGMSLTFHRAFDLCRAPLEALDQLISLGYDRVLTSGCEANAVRGIPMLRSLVERAAGRIVIMPGCGVKPENAAQILRETGARELHASASTLVPSRMAFRKSGVAMGRPDADEYAITETSEATVRGIVQAIAKL